VWQKNLFGYFMNLSARIFCLSFLFILFGCMNLDKKKSISDDLTISKGSTKNYRDIVASYKGIQIPFLLPKTWTKKEQLSYSDLIKNPLFIYEIRKNSFDVKVIEENKYLTILSKTPDAVFDRDIFVASIRGERIYKTINQKDGIVLDPKCLEEFNTKRNIVFGRLKGWQLNDTLIYLSGDKWQYCIYVSKAETNKIIYEIKDFSLQNKSLNGHNYELFIWTKNNKTYVNIGWISSSKDIIYKFNYQGRIKDAFKYLSDIQQVSK
jgi:hypothetical protein